MSIGSLMRGLRDSLVSLRAMFVGLCRNIPVFGGLVDCKIVDHASAAKEVFIGLLFSTVTFWLSAALIYFQGKTKGHGVVAALADSFAPAISNGELFVFSVSVIGPIVYIAFDESAGQREFPQKLWHAAALTVITLVCGALFAAVKTSASLDMPLVVEASVWLAASAVLLRYLATVFNKSRSRPSEEMRAETEEFITRFDKHREGESDEHPEGGHNG